VSVDCSKSKFEWRCAMPRPWKISLFVWDSFPLTLTTWTLLLTHRWQVLEILFWDLWIFDKLSWKLLLFSTSWFMARFGERQLDFDNALALFVSRKDYMEVSFAFIMKILQWIGYRNLPSLMTDPHVVSFPLSQSSLYITASESVSYLETYIFSAKIPNSISNLAFHSASRAAYLSLFIRYTWFLGETRNRTTYKLCTDFALLRRLLIFTQKSSSFQMSKSADSR
jgi:hypothetical protein